VLRTVEVVPPVDWDSLVYHAPYNEFHYLGEVHEDAGMEGSARRSTPTLTNTKPPIRGLSAILLSGEDV
jgi:hypothetical protein